MAEANVIGKPEQQDMGGASARIEEAFGKHESILVKQTMRGCLQECMGCEAKSEYKISGFGFDKLDGRFLGPGAMDAPNEMYALEDSSFCCRCCWRDGRPFDMKVSQGEENGGPGIVNFKKPCGFPLNFEIPAGENGSVTCPCCCMLPMVETTTPDGAPLGSSSRYVCDINLYVPKLKYAENGKDIYTVKPETCCGGCCIAINCGGKGCCFVPFRFYDEQNGGQLIQGEGDNHPMILKVWAGMKKECCSTADTFAVFFPKGCDAKRKAGLLGMTFLIDFTVFERQQENGGGPA